MPRGVGHVGDARRTIATNGPHDGERHDGKPGQRKHGSRHEDDGVAGPGAMAASCKRAMTQLTQLTQLTQVNFNDPMTQHGPMTQRNTTVV